jgi:K+/H+ antiporter YhaU regulatory subunit KhtT
MWPRVLMQLVELLPHATRLIPIAERYFASKNTNEQANMAALAALSEDVQTDLGQVTKAHAGLYRQLQEQSALVQGVGDDVRQLRSSLDQADRRIKTLEERIGGLNLWVRLGVSIITVLLFVILGLLLRK